jgi:hypothetical protein
MARHEVEALWALASGELDAEARARVEEHVAGCDTCAQRLAEVRETRALLRVAREEAPPVRWSEADDRVLTMATRRFARLEQRPRWPWVLGLAGACTAAVLALVLLRPGTAPQVPEENVVAQRVEETPSPALSVEVEGEASAWGREVGGSEQALQAGSGLRAGATVRTPAQGSARLRLPDASRMQVAADSEVVLSRVAADDVHLKVMRGRVAVRASHAERRGFVVEAAGLRVFVVGTIFSVEHTPQGPAVSVLEGKVRVEADGQPPQFATAGQHVELRASERAWKQRPLSLQDRRAFEALGVRVKAPATTRPPAAPTAPVAEVTAPTVSTVPEQREEPAPTPPQEPKADPWAPPTKSTPPTVTGVAQPVPAVAPDTTSTPAPEVAWQRFPAPREVEERFLIHARSEVATRTCESYLVGLGEIAEQSKVRPFREEARYLRARCHEVRFAPSDAAAEYRLYLKEYPRGRWAEEARVALLP